MKTKYSIRCLHRGQKLSFCGMGGRFWFAKPPSAAQVEYKNQYLAKDAIEAMPHRFERMTLFVPLGRLVTEYVDTRHITFFIEEVPSYV